MKESPLIKKETPMYKTIVLGLLADYPEIHEKL
jgi:hypothetical protein